MQSKCLKFSKLNSFFFLSHVILGNYDKTLSRGLLVSVYPLSYFPHTHNWISKGQLILSDLYRYIHMLVVAYTLLCYKWVLGREYSEPP